MLPNFDFRRVTTILSVQIMPAIWAISTFSKQMDINWDYIKDCQRDIYVKRTVEYRSLQVLQPKHLVTPCRHSLHYTHEPTVTQVFAKRLAQIVVKKTLFIPQTESQLVCSFLRINYFAIILGLTNSNTNDTAQ